MVLRVDRHARLPRREPDRVGVPPPGVVREPGGCSRGVRVESCGEGDR